MFYKDNYRIRNKIAKKGKLKYHKFMSSKIVSEYIINKTFNIKSNKKYLWEKINYCLKKMFSILIPSYNNIEYLKFVLIALIKIPNLSIK